MKHSGLAKLVEELGELSQVAGKMLQYPETDEHPDGGPPLTQRLADEMSDVIASIMFVAVKKGLDEDYIQERTERKLELYESWDTEGNGTD